MSSHVNSVIDHQKERLRNEISSQVEEFLKNGGSIDVLNRQGAHHAKERSSVWHSQNEFTIFVDA